MKFSAFCLASAAIPWVLANFWMVYHRRYTQIGRVEYTAYGTSFVPDTPQWTCEDDTFAHRIFPDRRDVGGHNYGIQFDPWGSQAGPLWHDPLIDVKINISPSSLGQQIISHDHNYAMIDAKGEQSGQCYLNRTFIVDLDC